MAILEIIDGPDVGRLYVVEQETYIGRAREKPPFAAHFISLPDSAVSRTHARILRRPGHYLIEDLNSTNGTFVAGHPIASGVRRPLHDGDRIRISSTELLFRGTGSGDGGDAPQDGAGPQGELPVVFAEPGDGSPQLSMVIDASPWLASAPGAAAGGDEAPAELLKRLQAMAQVSIALGAEPDQRRLTDKIAQCLFDIFPRAERALILLCNAPGGQSLIPIAARLRNGKVLGEQVAISSTVINEVIQERHAILSVDASGDERFRAQESVVGLHMRGLMCAPLLIDDEVLGLIQVDSLSGGDIFGYEDLQILSGISTQVAIALKNAQLYGDIENLFQSFVQASVRAIEARDPTTAGHSFRVAEYCERLAVAVDRSERREVRDVRFSSEQLRELRYAALLHDFGKVGVREHILTKPKNLFPHQLELITQRFRYARASVERRALRALLELHERGDLDAKTLREHRREVERELDAELHSLDYLLGLVEEANDPSVLPEEPRIDLGPLTGYCFPGEGGDSHSLLTDGEIQSLAITGGTLTPEERIEIESHVSHTFDFLSLIPWTKDLAGVPDIAHAHHEKLDGSGYPRGLRRDEIPIQSRVMTITDIYDALTARDRPYKPGLGEERALDILAQDARAGKIEQALLDIFVESKAYRLLHTE
jgi:3',5'-cyclic-nucleotide phosphodiesterase